MNRTAFILTLILGWTFITGQSFQSALEPSGPQAESIRNLWWVFLAVLAAIFVIVAHGRALARAFRDRKVAKLHSES